MPAVLTQRLPSRGQHPPPPPRRWTGLAYAAVLLASLASLALQPGPGEGGLPDEPLLSLAAWAGTATDWFDATADRSGASPADR